MSFAQSRAVLEKRLKANTPPIFSSVKRQKIVDQIKEVAEEISGGKELIRRDVYNMVAEFNDHFEVPRAGRDHRLPYDFQLLKIRHMQEELQEYRDAVEAGDMERAFDALIDLVYVAVGAAHAHKFKYDAGFTRVHKANMRKRRAKKASDSKRGSKYDVVKPEGWAPASLADLM